MTQLGHDEFDRASSPSVAVRVRESVDGSLSADLSVTTSMTTTRTIEGDSCADVVRAAALSAALAIEQETVEHKPEPPAPLEVDRPVSGPAIREDRAAITASGVTTLGLLPRPAVGVAGSARVRVSRAVWLSGRGYFLPGASMPDETFALDLVSAGAGACLEPFGSGSVAMVACAHAMIGSFSVTKRLVELTDRSPSLYVGGALSGGARARIVGPLHLEGAISAELPLIRPTYVTTACPRTGFEPAFVALSVWLGAGISIR